MNDISKVNSSEYFNGSYTNGTVNNETLSEYDSTLYNFKLIYGTFHGYLSLVVCIFGIVTNIANIIVLTRSEMRSPTNAILTGLAVADMLVMLDYVPYTIHNYIHSGQSIQDLYSYGWSVYALFHAHFSVVCHAISIWLTLLLAIWRYIAVRHPTESKIWCSMRKTVIFIVVTHLAVIVSCIPVYLSYTIHQSYSENGEIYYRVDWSPIALESDAFLKKLNFWVFSVATKLGPCILLTYLSLTLIAALIEADKRRRRLKNKPNISSSTALLTENSSSNVSHHHHHQHHVKVSCSTSPSNSSSTANDRTNRMLVAVLLLFLLAEFPSGILTLLSGILDEHFFHNVYAPLGEIIDMIALINSSINFVLYCSMSSVFRETFLQLFCATCSRRTSSPTTTLTTTPALALNQSPIITESQQMSTFRATSVTVTVTGAATTTITNTNDTGDAGDATDVTHL